MRILIAAMACHPTRGSEAKFGWDAAQAVAEFADCHVITHEDNRADITEHQVHTDQPNPCFHFLGNRHTWHPSRLVARLQSWIIFSKWQRSMFSFCLTLHARQGFDIVHHVTYATWRVPSPLWKLPIPFIWGPIGGASTTPIAFYQVLGQSSRSFETLRSASNLLTRFSPAFKASVRNAAVVLAAESETASFLSKQRGKDDVRTVCPAFFSQQQIDYLSCHMRTSNMVGPLRVFGGGNLEGRKGVALALYALAKLKKNGIETIYTLGGSGPERSHLEQLAAKLGISDSVEFTEGFTGDAYRDQLAATDVYLLPSLRETAGITMMEAMLAGCYAVVLSGTGAGEIVERTAGAALSAADPEEAIAKIFEQLVWCHFHRREMLEVALLGSEKIRSLYSKEAYQKAIFEAYAEAIESYR
jgi:glycosyltransferase involved in cell wall biosynthesis